MDYHPPTDPNLPADAQHIDDDPTEEKPEPEDMDDDSDDEPIKFACHN